MGSTKKKPSVQNASAVVAAQPEASGQAADVATKAKPAAQPQPSAKPKTASAKTTKAAVSKKAVAKPATAAQAPASKPAGPAKKSPAAKSATKAVRQNKAAAAAPKEEAVAKSNKAKLVRDSFTMPRDDFDLIGKLKERALGFKQPVKKSELLRAGLHALQSLPDAQLKAVLNGLTPLKAGRPKKQAD